MPHTKEWFEWLETRNPQQALFTRTVIAVAGKNDVCSICGDEPAPVYRSVTETMATLRLCSDCHRIRASQHERFELWEPSQQR